MRYGLWDTERGGWIGTNDAGTGPRTYDDAIVARIAEQVVGVQLGWIPGRLRAREYVEGAYRETETLDTHCDSLTALEGIESGRLM